MPHLKKSRHYAPDNAQVRQWFQNWRDQGSQFGRSVNPIPTGEGRLSQPNTTGTPDIFHLPASLGLQYYRYHRGRWTENKSNLKTIFFMFCEPEEQEINTFISKKIWFFDTPRTPGGGSIYIWIRIVSKPAVWYRVLLAPPVPLTPSAPSALHKFFKSSIWHWMTILVQKLEFLAPRSHDPTGLSGPIGPLGPPTTSAPPALHKFF